MARLHHCAANYRNRQKLGTSIFTNTIFPSIRIGILERQRKTSPPRSHSGPRIQSIPILVNGQHCDGLFQRVTHYLTGPELLLWERCRDVQVGLRRLVTLVHRLRDLARRGGKTYLAVYRMDLHRDRLEIHEINDMEKHPIPQHIVDRFWAATVTLP